MLLFVISFVVKFKIDFSNNFAFKIPAVWDIKEAEVPVFLSVLLIFGLLSCPSQLVFFFRLNIFLCDLAPSFGKKIRPFL